MARPERFELPTPRFVVWCSIQLSYGRLRRFGNACLRRQEAAFRRFFPGWQAGICRGLGNLRLAIGDAGE